MSRSFTSVLAQAGPRRPLHRALLVCLTVFVGAGSVFGQDLAAANSAIDRLRAAAGGEVQVVRSPRNGLANFIAAPRGAGIPISDRSAITAGDRALSFVEDYGRAFGLRREEVAITRVETDTLGLEHVRLRQVISGVPVTGGELVVHMRGRQVEAANGQTLEGVDQVNVIPSLSALEAEQIARSFTAKNLKAPNPRFSAARLEILNQPLLGGKEFPTRLAWFVEVTDETVREFVWIDAARGIVLLHFSQLTDAKNRSIYDGNNSFALPGSPVRSEGGGAVAGPAAVDANNAYDYSGITYDYYFSNHGRDSYDNAGGALKSTVRHCPDDNNDGVVDAGKCPYPNAFWDGQQMVYGAGYAGADDVVAHELTHAVTEKSANLFYYMQSGALNESFSDIFGETVDQLSNAGGGNDAAGVKWQIGEDLPAGALRSMADPTAFGDPGKMSDSQFFCTNTPTSANGDAGGVHFNSGVPNHAFQLMVDGGTYNSVTVVGIGLAKAAKIQYRALTSYLTSASNFIDNYNALQVACSDLVGTAGITSGNCAEVKKAVDAVQMSNLWPCGLSFAKPTLCSAGTLPVNLFFDGFEAGLGNWAITGSIPSGAFTPTGANGIWGLASNSWGANAFNTSGVESLWGFNAPVTSETFVALNANLSIPGAARLQFAHSYGFENDSTNNYDGGVVEYSVDGGGTWIDLNGLRIEGANYGGGIFSGDTNPLAGRSAFVKDSFGFTSSQYDLNSLAGQTGVRFRFRMGTDSTASDYGWFIDDFRVYTCASNLVTTNTATAVTQFSATLNGTINPNGAATAGKFQYGPSASYGNETAPQNLGSGSTDVLYSASSIPFECGTTYHYRAVRTSSTGPSPLYGADQVFATNGSCLAPTVTTQSATSITGSSAVLNGTFNPNGRSTEARFEYGLTTAYGATTWSTFGGPATTPSPFQVLVPGLTCGTTYHYRAIATNATGTSVGADMTFTPAPCPPVVVTGVATGVTGIQATFNATINPGGLATTAAFDFGLTTSYGGFTPNTSVVTGTSAAPFSWAVGSLTCGTTYHFRARATNSAGTTLGADATFTTPCPPTVTTIETSLVTQTTGTLNGVVYPNGNTTTTVFEYGKTATYGSTTSVQNLGTESVVAPSADIAGLTCGTRYHYRISATNVGGTSKGADETFFTSACGNYVARKVYLGPIASQVQAGYDHSCALTTTGGVKCWGQNESGQLGDGTQTLRRTPVDVVGLTSGVVAISTRILADHTCALTTTGGVKCWGRNDLGQLGDGTFDYRSTPVDVVGLSSGVVQISAGAESTCALTAAGAVKCWGANFHGTLGDGTLQDSPTPVNVSGLNGVVKSVSVSMHACAVMMDGSLKCWGRNESGQLGNGTLTRSTTPVPVTGLGSGVASVATGSYFTCAVTTAGGLKCWGWNASGQLADGTTTSRSTPADAMNLTSGVKAVTAGNFHACAVTTGGGVKCWGEGNGGRVGDGTGESTLVAKDVSGLQAAVDEAAAGAEHTCVVLKGGSVKCWGSGTSGQLGNGVETYGDVSTPQDISVIAGSPISGSGSDHTCVLTAAGGAKCWGANDFGQIGKGTVTPTIAEPTDVTGLTSNLIAVETGIGGSSTCAVTTEGTLKCWGKNVSGNLGDGTTTNRSTPIDVTGVSNVAGVAMGVSHTCALTKAGGVRCWGSNAFGQLGDGTNIDRLTPVTIAVEPAKAIYAGDYHTCVLVTDGSIRCWGKNDKGQLGDGTTTNRSSRVSAPVITYGHTGLALGGAHTCAVTSSGGVKCWGFNDGGQLGNGTTTDSLTAVDVSTLTSGVLTVGAGFRHSCAMLTSGEAKCWGANSDGGVDTFALGNGVNSNQLTPVLVGQSTIAAASLMIGRFYGCVATSAGDFKCWGSNNVSQLGDGSTIARPTPVTIRLGQSLGFTPPSTLSIGVATSLTAFSTSGLPATFDTWTPTRCAIGITGDTVTASAAGICGIRVSQAGDGNNAASNQLYAQIAVVAGPTVVTSPATAIIATGATLNGSVNPNGLSTTGSFEYGPTLSYGTTTTGQSLGSGSSSVSVTANIAGLTCGTLYHFRARATNSAGSVNGADATFTPPCGPSPAAMTSPSPASNLGGASQTFAWNTGNGASQYWLSIGNTPGGTQLYDLTQGANLSVTVNGLPTDGRTLYVRLWSKLGASWVWNDYTYTAFAIVKAVMTGPVPGSTLGSSTQVFVWNAGSGISEYWLSIGNTVGGGDIYDFSEDTFLSETVSNLPTDGRTLYVRLWSKSGTTWLSNDYTYTAYSAPAVKATMTSPTAGSTLSGTTQTFTWNTGTAINQYWLSVGNVPGGTDIYDLTQGTNLSVTLNNLPTDGRTLYVRLWSKAGTTWLSSDYTYTAFVIAKAAMLTPAPGSTLGGSSQTFTWSSGSGINQYWLSIGNTPAGTQLYDATQGTNLSIPISGLPTDGRTLYVRLWSKSGTTWLSNDYTYTAYSAPAVKAVMTSPAAGSILGGTTQTFTWNTGTAINQYWLSVGNAPGGTDIYDLTQGTNLSVTLNNLPTDGRTLYVRLWSKAGTTWLFNDYTFTALVIAKAAMVTPAPGSTLGGSSQTFTWNTGSGINQYWLSIGTTPGGVELYDATQGTNLSVPISGLPVDGRTLYVRLWSKSGTTWLSTDYTYTAYTTPVVKAVMTSPTPGSTLAGTSQTFTWNAGSGISQYWLSVGSTPGGADIYDLTQGTSLSKTLTGLPADGRTLYVRLWSKSGTTWLFNDYTCVAFRF